MQCVIELQIFVFKNDLGPSDGLLCNLKMDHYIAWIEQGDIHFYQSELFFFFLIFPHQTRSGNTFIKDFFSKCDQIRRKLRTWSHLQKKPLMENFSFFVQRTFPLLVT